MEYTATHIRQLVQAFENRTLPKSDWTHEAHLITSVWFCSQHDEYTALNVLREGIKKYNESVGTPNSETEGYHETITRFWVWQTRQFILQFPVDDIVLISNAFLKSESAQKIAPLSYYSREQLFSKLARRKYVKADLQEMKDAYPMNKYLIIERFKKEKVKELYDRFEKEGRHLPEGVMYIDSWIDENVEVCYQLMESEHPDLLDQWISHWKDFATFEVIPVINSLQAKKKVLKASIR